MFFSLKKFHNVFLSLMVLLVLTGCGNESYRESPATTDVDRSNARNIPSDNAVPVNILSIIDSSGTTKSKPYQTAIVKLSVTSTDNTDASTVEIASDSAGQISAIVPLLSGKNYNISAAAYENADGSGPVRYRGDLQTGVILPDTSQLTIHLTPASAGSAMLITQMYVAAITSSEATLAADITSSDNLTVTYFEWRPANTTEYTRTRITTLGSGTSATIKEPLTGLQINTTYYFRVVAVNSEGSISEPEISFTTGSGTALLSWSPPTTNVDGTPLNDLKGYKLYHRDPAGKTTVYDILNSTLPQQSPTVHYTLTSLVTGLHFFRVTAYDLYGNESAPTPELRKTFN